MCTAAGATDCPVISVTGAPHEQAASMGEYRLQPGKEHDGRPAYYNAAATTQHDGYWLYHIPTPGVPTGQWNIGPAFGMPASYLRVFDAAQTPDAITAEWQEYDPAPDTYPYAPSVKANCVPTPYTCNPTSGKCVMVSNGTQTAAECIASCKCVAPHNCGQLNGTVQCGAVLAGCNVCDSCCQTYFHQHSCDGCFAAPVSEQGCGGQ
jgi:hypothetical protein